MALDKSVYVREMFASIAPRYDLTNRVLTAGVDERWRARAVKELAAPAGARVADLCCGTGDLTFALARSDGTLAITGVDFCAPMLDGARLRARKEGAAKNLEFVEGDVLALPFESGTFGGAIMGFSLRNVVDIDAALREIRRVLAPGARFVNLDVSKVPNPLWRRAFELYFYGLVPLIGGLVGGNRSAYRYLPNSLTNHPNADELRERFERAGFREARYVRLAGGAIAIHVGSA